MKITKEDLKKIIADKITIQVSETSKETGQTFRRDVVSPTKLAEFLVENDIIKIEN